MSLKIAAGIVAMLATACSQPAVKRSSVQAVSNADLLRGEEKHRFINAYLEQLAWAKYIYTPIPADSADMAAVTESFDKSFAAADEVRQQAEVKTGAPHNAYPFFFDLVEKDAGGQPLGIMGPVARATEAMTAMRYTTDDNRESTYYAELKAYDIYVLENLEKNIAPLNVDGAWTAALEASSSRLSTEIDALTRLTDSRPSTVDDGADRDTTRRESESDKSQKDASKAGRGGK